MERRPKLLRAAVRSYCKYGRAEAWKGTLKVNDTTVLWRDDFQRVNKAILGYA